MARKPSFQPGSELPEEGASPAQTRFPKAKKKAKKKKGAKRGAATPVEGEYGYMKRGY